MLVDMTLAGLSVRTQYEYVRAVRRLAESYGVSPDKLTEQQVRQYIVKLQEVSPQGSFLSKFYGIKFFYYRTLGLNWDLFTKKKSANHDNCDCLVL